MLDTKLIAQVRTLAEEAQQRVGKGVESGENLFWDHLAATLWQALELARFLNRMKAAATTLDQMLGSTQPQNPSTKTEE